MIQTNFDPTFVETVEQTVARQIALHLKAFAIEYGLKKSEDLQNSLFTAPESKSNARMILKKGDTGDKAVAKHLVRNEYKTTRQIQKLLESEGWDARRETVLSKLERFYRKGLATRKTIRRNLYGYKKV